MGTFLALADALHDPLDDLLRHLRHARRGGGLKQMIDGVEELTETGAVLLAFDLALAGLDRGDRHALRNFAEIAMGRLDGVCSQVEVLRGEGAVMLG